jgi:arylsulfatase A-like enzyme
VPARHDEGYSTDLIGAEAVRWPAAWRGGRKVIEPLAYIDVLPMLARIAGVESLPEHLDGTDICDVLGGGRTRLQREVYLGPQALVGARWKLVAGQLFDVATDPGEMKDVAQDHPEVVQRLQRRLVGLQ